jgi:teichuronic acid biosynthesis glycosyltransferase TuaC
VSDSTPTPSELRVLVVTNMYPVPQYPWYGNFVRDQVKALERRGVRTEVFFIDGRASRWNYLRAVPRLRAALKRGSYDLIHAHYVFSGMVARCQRRLPILLNFHGADEALGYQGFLCRSIAPFVDEIVVTSDYHKSLARIERAHVLPCGVDMELFRPMDPEAARRELGLAPEAKLVLFPAALRPEKRIDVARAAMEILRRRDPRAELVVASGQPHERIPLYMNACDTMVMTSDLEGSPVSIKEAMACNLPIVSVRVSDVPETIGTTRGCFLCDRTPEDVAQKLGEALGFGGRTDGRERIRRYDIHSLVDRLLDLYRIVLEKKARKSR